MTKDGSISPRSIPSSRNRVLGDRTNRTISAVAVLLQTEANRELIEKETANAGQAGNVGDIARAIVTLSEEAPEAFAQVPYLRVHHNPFAWTKLPTSVFNGPHDQHIWPDFLPTRSPGVR
jgi:hypothetical protein